MEAILKKLLAFCLVAGCTYGNISATPIQLPDGTEAFKYTGRANFGYQLDEADQAMAATCASIGKRPVIVQQGTRAIGAGAVFTDNAAGIGMNQQQDIIFRCK